MIYTRTENTLCYYTQIRKEYTKGKANFSKRYPIMEQNAKDMYKAGKISALQLGYLLKRLNYYKNMNEVRR